VNKMGSSLARMANGPTLGEAASADGSLVLGYGYSGERRVGLSANIVRRVVSYQLGNPQEDSQCRYSSPC
jgi:hypothetical protein